MSRWKTFLKDLLMPDLDPKPPAIEDVIKDMSVFIASRVEEKLREERAREIGGDGARPAPPAGGSSVGRV